MRRKSHWHWNLIPDRSAALLALCAVFLLGSAIGCAAAGILGTQQKAVLLAELHACLSTSGREHDATQFFDVLWRLLGAPTAVILFGFSAFGVIAVPAAFFVRGFLSTYAISVFYRLLGAEGLLAGGILFVVSALFWLPAFLELGMQGLLGACALMRRLRGDFRAVLPFNKVYFIRCGICAVALCVGAAAEYFIVPWLLQAASGILSIS